MKSLRWKAGIQSQFLGGLRPWLVALLICAPRSIVPVKGATANLQDEPTATSAPLTARRHQPDRPAPSRPATGSGEMPPRLTAIRSRSARLESISDPEGQWDEIPVIPDEALLRQEAAAQGRDRAGRNAAAMPAHCPTPRSLMLHGHYGAERMEALAIEISDRGLQTLTYRDILAGIRRGECPPEQGIVVSLDDLYTSWIDPEFKTMISAFTERDLVLVLGVIVSGPQDPQAWDYLRSLERLGVEVASHTVDHPNLPELSPVELDEQISGSYHLICENLGKCPVSLIVPYGSMDAAGRIMEASHDYAFVVGIAGGLTIEGDAPYYVGRAGPNIHSINLTLQVLDVAFGS